MLYCDRALTKIKLGKFDKVSSRNSNLLYPVITILRKVKVHKRDQFIPRHPSKRSHNILVIIDSISKIDIVISMLLASYCIVGLEIMSVLAPSSQSLL